MGGSADANALKAVAADRTVYAAFTATTRTYTVYFQANGSTLQTVQNVPYGGSATYTGSTPTKSGVDNPDDYPFLGWSPAPTNITGNTTCVAQFGSPLEDAEIEDSWDTILANVANGTYATKYNIGNYKPLDLGTEGIVNMQIVAKNADTLASGGTAPLTWISKELLNTNKRMNPGRAGSEGAYTVGTGSVGGWAQSEMRTYMSTLKAKIPSSVAAAIKTVVKTNYNNDSSGTSASAYRDTTNDDVWIPSKREIFGGTDHETEGPIYSVVYSDANSRKKMKVGATSAYNWWLRSACPGIAYFFRLVFSNGNLAGDYASSSLGVALGFCT